MSRRAQELFLADGRSAGVWYCATCKYTARSEAEAERCCAPLFCECGAEIERGRTGCDACWIRQREECEAATWDRATKVHTRDYDGPVYSERLDCFHCAAADAFEELIDEGCTPDRVYACNVHRLCLDVDDVLESAIEATEAADCDLEFGHVEELRAFVTEWNARQTSEWWETDYTRGIVEALEAADD